MPASVVTAPRARGIARLRHLLALGAAVALVGAGFAVPSSAVARESAADESVADGCSFETGFCQVDGQPGSSHEVAVPTGVSRITALVIGGAGGANSSGQPGGQGGLTMATFEVSAGQTLDVIIGGAASGAAPGVGFTSGGKGGRSVATPDFMPTGGGGGGSSAVLDGTSGEVIAVAGGGGGAGGDALGGGAPGGSGGDGGQPASSGGNGSPTGTSSDGAQGGDGGGAGQPDGEDNTTVSIAPTPGAGGGGYADGGSGGGGSSGFTGTPDGTEDYASAGGGGGGQSYVAPSVVTWRFLASGPWNAAGDGTVLLYTSSGSVFTCASGTQDDVLPDAATGVMVVAAGGAGESTEDNGQGGAGALVTGQFAVAGGTQLKVVVGCAGDHGGYGWSSGGAGGSAHDLTKTGGRGGGSSAVVPGNSAPSIGAGGGGGAGGPIFDAVCNCSGGNGGVGIGTPVAGGIGEAGAGGQGGGLFGGDGGAGGFSDGASGDDGQNGEFLKAPGGGGGGGIVSGGSFGRRGGESSAGGGGGAGSSYAVDGAIFLTGGTLDPTVFDDGVVLIIPVVPPQLSTTLTIDQPVLNATGAKPDVSVGVTCTVAGDVVTSEQLRFAGEQRTLTVSGIDRGAECTARILEPADAGAADPVVTVMDADKRISLSYDASKANAGGGGGAAGAGAGSSRLADTGASPANAVGLVALLLAAGVGALVGRRRFARMGR
ncbi:hypothetical protein SCB71_00925 [Herbiconiux sp. KACC 21604]|uniref:hypothetical protein n=1 Tax=unclassified Herbiconiux TaxID=2618217 RepID=UPI00149315C4|nr:hypothetical protein [Herbiconiux sp. SALV-R1]QJU55633.1 hypothetical protein HL652_19780 [Herbiconiux sp. SALV-R1]WPO86830.1 hypothetical protein SCB71_00925 [Herbiconiux sp. KACC 21604]